MISISNKFGKFLYAGGLGLLMLLAIPAAAQESLTLSVTPPLFQLSAAREQVWQSNIKVINSNSYPITVYANPVNFMPVGEDGRGQFLPVFTDETGGQTLAEWISITKEAIIIPPEQSQEIPFVVSVPPNAAPGGHFAAILIGTKPPEQKDVTAVRTAQVVSSLFFLTIDGDVVEKGSIREFSVVDKVVSAPQAEFVLRFQNDGNVHIRPQGEIKIMNMWGKERGVIPINHGSSFGNVLPNTTRKFQFSWTGESSLADIGRYTAIVTLGFGSKGRQTVSQEVSFWFIPIKLTLLTFGVLLTLVLIIRWAIKSYVRRMLALAGIDSGERAAQRVSGAVVLNKRLPTTKYQPIQNKDKYKNSTRTLVTGNWFLTFISEYWYFFIGIPSSMILLSLIFWYFNNALISEKNFEVTIGDGQNEIKINSEELKRQEQTTMVPNETPPVIFEDAKQPFVLRLVNVSGVPGTAAEISVVLEQAGYTVSALEPGLDRTEENTVIITDALVSESAQKLSKLLDNALVSFSDLDSKSTVEPEILIYVGKDALGN